MWETLFFWIFGGMAAVLAVLVVGLKNPIHGALALIANLFCVAALFVLLDAHFLAAIQVLVYAGAIMVLFVFVVMLLNLSNKELGLPRYTAAKVAGGGLIIFVALQLLVNFANLGPSAMGEVPPEFGTIESIGRLLFTQYLLPFEVASVILLAAILGAVAIAKKKIW
jgi:NADH-quinone oxidoreductase subunit J